MELKTLNLKDFSRAFLDDSRCDSPIEDLFYYDFQKVMSEEGTIHRQVECLTPVGAFRLDFMLQLPDRRVGFECDGKDFHDEEADSIRDRAIIDAGHVDRIYHLRGRDIHFRLHDALDLIAAQDKEVFSARGRANIKALASRDYEHLEDDVHRSAFFDFAALRRYTRPPRDPRTTASTTKNPYTSSNRPSFTGPKR